MVQQLWAPWRFSYVTKAKPQGCVLCAKPAEGNDEDALIVHRGELAYVVLNLFPYNAGHLMVVPFRHVGDFTEVTPEESAEMQRLLELSMRVLRQQMNPEGFNLGLNLGAAGGAGIVDHLHWQLVPRWQGDTNFMPVLAETKVMPMHMAEIWQSVHDGFASLDPTTHKEPA